MSNIPERFFSVSPIYLETTIDRSTRYTSILQDFPSRLAVRVFPVPGGPVKRTLKPSLIFLPNSNWFFRTLPNLSQLLISDTPSRTVFERIKFPHCWGVVILWAGKFTSKSGLYFSPVVNSRRYSELILNCPLR